MSTRACYIFKDQYGEYAVYKHHDGYPQGARGHIAAAAAVAWPLPRYEADEFGAAFVAANKPHDGGVRLINGSWESFPADIEYAYVIEPSGRGLKVTGYSVTDGGRGRRELVDTWEIAPKESVTA